MNAQKSDNTPGGAMSGGDLIHAVQYLRMSTEHQKYSTENQSDVIAEYAERNGMKVILTYADEGKSGCGGSSTVQCFGADGCENVYSANAGVAVYGCDRQSQINQRRRTLL